MIKLNPITIRSCTRFIKRFATTPTPVARAVDKLENETLEVPKSPLEIVSETQTTTETVLIKTATAEGAGKSTLVAAAFASLKSDQPPPKNFRNGPKKSPKKNVIDETIAEANSINDLLVIAENPIVARRHALKIVSTLADWSASGKVKLSEFETDVRFLKLCRILGRNIVNAERNQSRDMTIGDDLSTVLGVTGDDEAAKLVASITLPQMVKVLSSLAVKRRRSTPLLRSLAFNITKSSEVLDLKQSADILYAAATLTFPEISLLERTCNDICKTLENNKEKSAVVGSIVTSLGLLRYKNPDVLNSLSDWFLKHQDIARPQDLFALFMTLAMVSYEPANAPELYKVLIPQLNAADAGKPSTWVDLIWSLTVLNQVTPEHIASVLKPVFIDRLQNENCLSISTKVKLLNIQGAAQVLHKNYSGPFIKEGSDVHTVTIVRSREKQALVAAMLDSLGSLLPSVTYLRSNVDTGMGFLLDAECFVDAKLNPLPIAENEKHTKGFKIAFMAYDYHDLCRGNRSEPNGINVLTKRLLEHRGYRVITVPHTDFNPRDKLIRRVQYLETQLKSIIKQPPV